MRSRTVPRSRGLHLLLIVTVVALGLASRSLGDSLPTFVATYAGDTLWGLLVFLLVAFVRPGLATLPAAAMAIAFALTIEVSQLYQAPWINALRETTLGALVLGFGFLWSDLLCYAVGITLGAISDSLFVRLARTSRGRREASASRKPAT